MKRTAWTLAMAVLAALAGCNTVKGVGKDIQRAGQVIENAAKQ